MYFVQAFIELNIPWAVVWIAHMPVPLLNWQLVEICPFTISMNKTEWTKPMGMFSRCTQIFAKQINQRGIELSAFT